MMIRKICRKIRQECHGFIMRRRFRLFGRKSRIDGPYMLTNPERMEIGDNVVIRGYARLEAITTDKLSRFEPVIRIGRGTHIEQYFHLGACESVELGENVLIASRVYISDHNHCFKSIDIPIKLQGVEKGGKVVIGDNAWLGEGCAILPGVTIGKHAIVGTNAVVTRDIPPYSIAVGVPAKVIKNYDFASREWVAAK